MPMTDAEKYQHLLPRLYALVDEWEADPTGGDEDYMCQQLANLLPPRTMSQVEWSNAEFVPEGKGWLLDGDPAGPVVWTAPGGHVMIQRIEPGDLTPDQARKFAHNILAAAASTPAGLAGQLNYDQRKALRRISRRQSIPRSMQQDPLVRQFYAISIPQPDPDMDMIEWCDWQAKAMSARPKITPFGQEVLTALDGDTDA